MIASLTRRLITLLCTALLVLQGGCAAVTSRVTGGLADNLASAILNQDDPDLVRDGAPSYMLLLDSFLQGDNKNPRMLASAAYLYASYGAVFAADPVRAARLTSRGRNYAQAAMCEVYKSSCTWSTDTYNEFVASLQGLEAGEADSVYTYGFATLAFLRAHSDDWNSLAELPKVEALFNRYLEICGDHPNPAVHTYLGVLLTLRPPALGGKPEEARKHFEKAIELSHGRDLTAKVEYARGYARMMYDRKLHDRLLNEVLQADPYVEGLTLGNVLAQEQAAKLLADADDYF